MNSLFGKSAPSIKLDLEAIFDPTLIVECTGEISSANEAVFTELGYARNDLIGQNVEILVPSRVIKRTDHVEKMKAYKYGRKSDFIGCDKILPIKNSNDEDILMRVQIVPVQDNKKLKFLAFLKPMRELVYAVFQTGQLFEEISKRMKTMPDDYDFRTVAPQGIDLPLMGLIKEYIQEDLLLLSNMLLANCMTPKLVKYMQDLVMEPKSRRLKNLRNLLISKYSNYERVYVNIVALRLIFPPLIVGPQKTRDYLKEALKGFYEKVEAVSGPSNMDVWKDLEELASQLKNSISISE